MRAYGLAYQETMNLPMKVFWHLSGTVPRLIAGERKDELEMMVSSAHSPEGAGELFKSLDKASPDPVMLTVQGRVQIVEKLDSDGLNELRGMGSL